jgi:hypothetical protein
MLPEATALIAMLVTVALLAHGAALAQSGVDFILRWRAPDRSEAIAAACQYAGTSLGLIGLVYRHHTVAAIGLLLVILSVLLGGIGRSSNTPRFETGLACLAVVCLLALTLRFAVA